MEVKLAGLAAQRATQAELDDIEECLTQQRASINCPPEFLQKDLEFHNLIAQASHNTLFAIFLGSLRRTMSDKMQLLLEAPAPDLETNVASTLEEHRDIVKYLCDRRAKGASEAMRHHLEKVYAQWLKLSRRRAGPAAAS